MTGAGYPSKKQAFCNALQFSLLSIPSQNHPQAKIVRRILKVFPSTFVRSEYGEVVGLGLIVMGKE